VALIPYLEKKYAVPLSRKGRFFRPFTGTVLTVQITQSNALKVEHIWVLGNPRYPESFTFKGNSAKSVAVNLVFRWYEFGDPRTEQIYRVPNDAQSLPSGIVKITNPVLLPSYSTYSNDWSKRLARARQGPSRTFVSSRATSVRPPLETSVVEFNVVVGDTCRGSPTVTPSTYESYRRSWTGSRTPGWGKLKKRQYPVNPHTVVLRRVQDTLGISGFNTPVGACGPQTVWEENKTSALYPQVLPTEASGHDDSVLNLAVKRLIDRSDLDLQANLAQDLVQIGQTNRMILNTARRIRKAIQSVKRGNFSAAAEALWQNQSPKYRKGGGPSRNSNVASNWLELQYGWKPLLQDIHGSMNALAKYNYQSYQVQWVRASASKTITTNSPIYHSTFGSLIGSRYTETKTSAKIGVSFRLSNPQLALLAQTGFTNPLNLAWEVLPFSFVVDWFLPIGPYLESQSAFHGYAFLSGFQTQFTRQKTRSTIYYEGTHPGNSEVIRHFHYGNYTQELVRLNRIELTKFPALRFPRFKNGFSVEHVLNGLALMRVAFK